jgi:hypothetical protein
MVAGQSTPDIDLGSNPTRCTSVLREWESYSPVRLHIHMRVNGTRGTKHRMGMGNHKRIGKT